MEAKWWLFKRWRKKTVAKCGHPLRMLKLFIFYRAFVHSKNGNNKYFIVFFTAIHHVFKIYFMQHSLTAQMFGTYPNLYCTYNLLYLTRFRILSFHTIVCMPWWYVPDRFFRRKYSNGPSPGRPLDDACLGRGVPDRCVPTLGLIQAVGYPNSYS